MMLAGLAVPLLLVTPSALADPSDHFVTTWKTDNPGCSPNSQSIRLHMVGGPYDVDWDNDGVFDQTGLYDSTVHDFGSPGTYTVRVRGTYDSFADKTCIKSYFDLSENLIAVNQWGTNQWTSMDGSFGYTKNVEFLATDTPDFSAVTSMRSMFDGALGANPDTSSWDTSSVTNMSYMFYAGDTNPDTSGWDTSSVVYMNQMFRNNEVADPDVSGWDTSQVTTMWEMFRGTSANPDVSNWDTSNVTIMSFIFAYADRADPDVSGWDTSSVLDMDWMFFSAIAADPDVTGWDISSVGTMRAMFDQSGLSTYNYDRLLISWDNQVVQQNVELSALDTPYCASSAATARTNLIHFDNWTITDRGADCSSVTPSVPLQPDASVDLYPDMVHLTWAAVEGSNSYQVYRCAGTDTSSCGDAIAVKTNPHHHDTEAGDGVTYYYRIRACYETYCSDFSPHDEGRRTLPDKLVIDGFEALPPVCEPAAVEACYEGPSGTQGQGLCSAGTRTCNDVGQWGACIGWVGPAEDVCGDQLDNDCDLEVDETCCNPLETFACEFGDSCYLLECDGSNCLAQCSSPGPTGEGEPCTQSSNCRIGMQCFESDTGSVCLRDCDPSGLGECLILGGVCTGSGLYVDGQEIGACR